jgi:hypothetical protein
MNRHLSWLVAVAIAALWGFASEICFGEMYKWTDENGVLHFTDDKGNIPAKFRKNTKELEEQNYRINDELDAKRAKVGELKATTVAEWRKLSLERDRLDREIAGKQELCQQYKKMAIHHYALGDCIDSLNQLRSERILVNSHISEWKRMYNTADDIEKNVNSRDGSKRR